MQWSNVPAVILAFYTTLSWEGVESGCEVSINCPTSGRRPN